MVVVKALVVLSALNALLRPITAHIELKEELREGAVVDRVGDHSVIAMPSRIDNWQARGIAPEEVDAFDRARKLYVLAKRRRLV